MGFRGVDIRETGDRIVFRASLKDAAGNKLTSGTVELRIFELQSDGTLKSYDFNDNTFKTTALTTAVANMTHRQGNNSTYNTGFWTYALTTVTGFVPGNIYFAQVYHASASPPEQEREFQYGGTQDDFIVLGNVNDAGATTTDFDGDANLSASNDFYNGCLMVFLNGTLKGISRGITDYVGASKNFAFSGVAGDIDAAWPTAPANGDRFAIVGRFGT